MPEPLPPLPVIHQWLVTIDSGLETWTYRIAAKDERDAAMKAGVVIGRALPNMNFTPFVVAEVRWQDA